MKKICEYKWLLVIGLLIVPITFLLLITIAGMIIELIKYSNLHFNLIKYWRTSFSHWYTSFIVFLISLFNYFYYGFLICYSKKSGANIKSTNKTDYGSARWLYKNEIKKIYPIVFAKKMHSRHGFVVNTIKKNRTWFHNIKGNTHSLVIGGTGSGKTQCLVMPTINANLKSKYQPSMIITDVKGELYQEHYQYLKEKDYTVKIFNLRNIKESVAWNPLQSIYEQFKLMLKTSNMQKKLVFKSEIQSEIKSLVKMLFPKKDQVDPFWNDSGALITESIILGILEKTETYIKEDYLYDRRMIDTLLKKYLPSTRFNLASVAVIASSEKGMSDWFKMFPNNSIAKMTVNQILQKGTKTLASILITMSTQLAIFKDEFIRNLTCQNNLNFKDFVSKPTVLFIVVPDENPNYYFFASLLITQIYNYLITEANKNENNKLLRPVYYLCDEFGNLPTINNIATMITIARSRNIFFQLIIQDLQQLNEKYGPEVTNIIFANCSLHIFLQTMDLATAEKYSKMIGNKTVIQVTTGGRKETKSHSESLVGHQLIFASDLIKLPENKAIVIYAKKNPFQAILVPWYKISSKPKSTKIYQNKLKLIDFERDYFYDIKKE